MVWWYICFQPKMIREVGVGHLYVGRHASLALRLVYAPDEETHHAAYLAFADGQMLRRVWDNLLVDAPDVTESPHGRRERDV
jgi:hypothetical protein